ncbi:MAG: YggS family pyridoxal phosphate-dependent enzyme [Elusimicrobiota bacterium]
MIFERLDAIRKRVEAACSRSGRAAAGVEVLAVTKHAPVPAVLDLLKSGAVRHFGVNRIQDGARLKEALGEHVRSGCWRFIGHLQTNKARLALETFDWIDSIDSIRLAEALDKRLSQEGKRKKVLIQVKLSARDTQSGVAPDEVDGLLEGLRRFGSLEPAGLMAIAPLVEPVSETRPYFRKAREIFERCFGKPGPSGEGPSLSMGMSRDFEIAVEEGATLIRIGTALFQ